MSKTITFGQRLRSLREAAGLSVSELADRAGLSRKYIWQLQTERLQPSLDTARRLAEALGQGLAAWE